MSIAVRICVISLCCFLLLSGCAREHRDLRSLRTFITADEFHPDPGSAFPKPQKAPQSLLRFVDVHYDSDPRIRSAMATYFLRYQLSLLRRGLLTAASDAGDLLHAFWTYEERKSSWLRESPSILLMETHIRRNAHWLDLKASHYDQLAQVQRECDRLKRFWAETSPDRETGASQDGNRASRAPAK